MKNRFSDLNNHLFEQIERLSDEGLTGDALREEIERGKAITGVATQIILNGKLVLEAQKALSDGMIRTKKSPFMLGMLGEIKDVDE